MSAAKTKAWRPGEEERKLIGAQPEHVLMSKLRIPETFYTHSGKLFFTYRWSHELYPNKHFNGEKWEAVEEWAVFIGFNPKHHGWFVLNSGDNYHDGNTCRYVTLFGVTFGALYCCQAQPVSYRLK